MAQFESNKVMVNAVPNWPGISPVQALAKGLPDHEAVKQGITI